MAGHTMMMHNSKETPSQPFDKLPLHDAFELTGDDGLARIKLADQFYLLRITRAGKLILTK